PFGVSQSSGPTDATPCNGGDDGNNQKRNRDGEKCAGQNWLPPAPAPKKFRRTGRSRLNRFADKPALQVFRERPRGRVTARRIFFQAFEADHFQIAIDRWLQSPRTRRLAVNRLSHCLQSGASAKRRLAREQFIENRAKAINIRSRGRLRRFS